ncbi:transcriptional regulator [Ornithinibacter aureus]|uniref:Transcriptional regulator n=1 Tax=Ornithinibacter aureus TaxID=622664 RepID=A0ABP8JBI2_9MICO|nr:transcriptional regulator [Ornithinibacter aureus]KAF0832717.1 winged helix DNA-binding protein [Ornithinibacter aureus]
MTPDLDPVIHAPARLRIMAALAGLEPGDTLTFSRLQQLLALTGGNLITHLRRLEDAGYVTSQRVRGIRGEVTTASLTEQGRRALAAYRATLADILDPVDG